MSRTRCRPQDDTLGRACNRLDAKLLRRICAARGTYVWRGARFERARVAAATGTSAP